MKTIGGIADLPLAIYSCDHSRFSTGFAAVMGLGNAMIEVWKCWKKSERGNRRVVLRRAETI
jgi:hypothetical protein